MHEKSTTTPENLEEIAATIERFAAQYREVAADMRKNGVETIPLSGIATLRERAYTLITGNIARAKAAAVKAMFTRESQARMNAARAEADAVAKKLVGRKKKKPE